MHHGSPMPCLDLGYWGSVGSYVCANIGPLVIFCIFTRLTANFLGICRALSIAESIIIFGYPLSMSCFLRCCCRWSFFWVSVDSYYSYAQPKREGLLSLSLLLLSVKYQRKELRYSITIPLTFIILSCLVV